CARRLLRYFDYW
nr:immunoglobulin heavy chain junction region [Mus musculus]MBK4197327.1 immunoglobulin heavy chain junction region [Mus musculus]